MNWIESLIFGEGVAHSIMLFAFVIAGGIVLGKIKIKGISLGITFVLFVGISAGHFGFKIHHEVLHFMKEFGLILFVYSVGLQVGPGFLASFKKGGLQLNLLAVLIVVLGAITTVVLFYITDIPMSTMVGIMSGAVTNTPGLGAAQEAYFDTHGVGDSSIAMGYAVAYPLAVIGIIGSIILVRYLFKVNLQTEEEKLSQTNLSTSTVELLSLLVSNPAIFGKTIKDLAPLLSNRKFIVSRILHSENEQIEIASSHTKLNEGDKILVVTTPEDKAIITTFTGSTISMLEDDWAILDKQLISKRVLVTRSSINGKTIRELNLRSNFGVNITRINRAGIDLVAYPSLQLQIGDRVVIVGDANAIQNVSKTLGDQLKILNEPHLIPIFIGIFLGVFLGSIPFTFPGIPQPVKLGLAGGPLIAAILMSVLGVRYKLITYTTLSANLMLREIGICFFLACVGLGAGENFVNTVLYEGGLNWVGYGIIITLVPLFIVAVIARKIFKLNYYTLTGLMAGSMTDPPALAYANSSADNDAPAVSYASVYPLTMFLRVLVAQLLILLFL
ncbi:putative transporter [Dysgonomonas sp. BGC7]|uniref:putative transporter n=1 Tax=Dysgonomonas sp. BGC7 TaxID=1658008 RepID=UPI0006837ABF|nr:putative transporter [Dysgonomonas sp. BGC7]MBD8388176.1 putative transporter [Dysgonomonas sp. BGC7]